VRRRPRAPKWMDLLRALPWLQEALTWPLLCVPAQTFWFSTEGNLMYPISKVLCPPLRFLGITPNQITLFNIFIGLGSGYCLVHKLWLYTWVLNFMHQVRGARAQRQLSSPPRR
jgi:hypothetical protein